MDLPTTLSSWLSTLRPVLETLYFLSAIALAIFAYKGLEQLRITREIANKNTKREAFKLAADQCRYFADQLVPIISKALDEYRQTRMTCCNNRQFKIVKGEIAEHNFDINLIRREYTGDRPQLLNALNSLEGFALFFASGIAEESVGFQETGTAFCNQVKWLMPLIHAHRSNGVRYESTVKLYEIWSNRLESEALTRQRQSIDSKLKGMDKESIKILGA